MIVIIKYAVV